VKGVKDVKTHTVALLLVVGVASASLFAIAHAQSPTQGSAAQQTPAQCLADVRAYVTKRSAELRPMTSDSAAKLTAERTAMVRDCAAKFDVKTVPVKDLSGLADLYSDAGMVDLANAAVARAMADTSLTGAEHAQLMEQSIRLVLREPKGDERNARLETMVDALDKLPDTDAFNQKFNAHYSMNNYYRADDIDAGIIKHSTWLIETGAALSPDMRKRYGPQILSAYVNMAEAWAGQGMNDKAIALLKRAPTDWAEIPNVSARIDPTLARYMLVGTPAAAITAPTWLNMPAGSSTVDMKGHVTLLEFTAHWCGPCRESYPGVNRLRDRFGSKGFRVVMATQLYGYFQAERNLDAATELARDRDYFGEHHLDVPVAVSDKITVSVKDGVVVYSPAPDPNDTAYKVGGIPQIQIIDRQGRIRLIMVGYDDANEPKLAKFIEGLLAEK
jgi:thiol-disulfide isomerase/thioredoxin